eukprot:NODE_535_length_1570_cov_23.182774_g404_i0.p1 GENE.NODE_535_length_1570_cov_23.182774_g404_i0~~NODE_535_length_1570_cov_23.182774_g404_i0.p1  ORF type:complete len:310 (+),score=45.19 NODE_535_length_1570_cov_23.182774_g404_i0:58-987(+)
MIEQPRGIDTLRGCIQKSSNDFLALDVLCSTFVSPTLFASIIQRSFRCYIAKCRCLGLKKVKAIAEKKLNDSSIKEESLLACLLLQRQYRRHSAAKIAKNLAAKRKVMVHDLSAQSQEEERLLACFRIQRAFRIRRRPARSPVAWRIAHKGASPKEVGKVDRSFARSPTNVVRSLRRNDTFFPCLAEPWPEVMKVTAPIAAVPVERQSIDKLKKRLNRSMSGRKSAMVKERESLFSPRTADNLPISKWNMNKWALNHSAAAEPAAAAAPPSPPPPLLPPRPMSAGRPVFAAADLLSPVRSPPAQRRRLV